MLEIYKHLLLLEIMNDSIKMHIRLHDPTIIRGSRMQMNQASSQDNIAFSCEKEKIMMFRSKEISTRQQNDMRINTVQKGEGQPRNLGNKTLLIPESDADFKICAMLDSKLDPQLAPQHLPPLFINLPSIQANEDNLQFPYQQKEDYELKRPASISQSQDSARRYNRNNEKVKAFSCSKNAENKRRSNKLIRPNFNPSTMKSLTLKLSRHDQVIWSNFLDTDSCQDSIYVTDHNRVILQDRRSQEGEEESIDTDTVNDAERWDFRPNQLCPPRTLVSLIGIMEFSILREEMSRSVAEVSNSVQTRESDEEMLESIPESFA